MWGLRLSILLTLCAAPASAHEFWIEPEEYQVETGEPVTATLRNGEEFKGISLGWFDRRFIRFDMAIGEDLRPVTGRMGDTPAMQAEAWDEGLMVVVHETTPSTVTYRDWDKFLRFVDHKDFRTAVETHEARDWPMDLFRESYTRHVKALIAVGDGSGSDREFGLATEFVALTNPYSPDFDGQMQVRLTYDGAPRANAQVEVFEMNADGAVEITLHRTDSDGLTIVPVLPGHAYLFDAVVLRPAPDADTSDRAVVWETLWAALTFAVPAP